MFHLAAFQLDLCARLAALHWKPLQAGVEHGLEPGVQNNADCSCACAAFSCFADLALVSPQDYRLEGQGSLLQCVLTPADPFMPLPNEDIAARTHREVASPVGSPFLLVR